jgi:hypothetical protein
MPPTEARTFDVAVDLVAGMQILHGFQRLAHDDRNVVLVERPFLQLGRGTAHQQAQRKQRSTYQVENGTAAEVLHYNAQLCKTER